jgi:FkbM family methyltransferase
LVGVKDKKMDALETLRHLPRYSAGSTRVNGLLIHYNDPLALYNEYKDIFIKKIYDFRPGNDNPLILDVGGYIGLSAMYFKITFPGAQIKIFEPDPGVFNLLKTNIEINHFSDIVSFNAGVAKEESSCPFFPDGADGGNPFVQKQDKTIEVSMVKLSDYIDGPIDLLKMNIEGMEGDVFEEIEHQLPLIREIIFEYHAFHNLPQHLGKILSILDRKGFRYLVTDVPCAPTPVPFKMNKNYKYFNLVYARNTALVK